MLKKICWFLCIICFVVLLPARSVEAQDSSSAKITVENADQLIQWHDIALDIDGVQEMAFTSDSTTLLIYSKPSLLRFNMITGKAEKPLTLDAASLRDIAVSADDVTLAYVSADCNPGNCTSKVVLLDMKTSKVTQTFKVSGFSDGLALSADGALLAYSDNKTDRISQANQVGTTLGPSTIHIVDVKTGKEQQNVTEKDGILGDLFISPDGTQLAYNSMEWKTINGGMGTGKLHYIDLSTGKELRVFSINHLVKTISPDWSVGFVSTTVELPGLMTFSAASPRLIDLKKGETISELAGAQDVAFDPSSEMYALTGVTDGVISLNRLEDQKGITQLKLKSAKYIFLPLFSPDGTLFVSMYRTASDKFYVSVWGIGTAPKS